MKKHSGTRETGRGIRRWLTPITVAAVLLLVALNVGLTALLQYKSLYVDLTPEGLYTLSDTMVTECDKVDADITITFCSDPDRLLANSETRYVYVLATELSNRYDNIEVETYNLTLNPTALDRFRTTSASRISEDKVIVSSGDRYRIYSASSFWMADSNDADGDYWAFNGEYVMATAFFSLSLINNPVAYYVYNHGESYYVSPEDEANAALLAGSDEDGAAFYDLLIKAGLRVGYLDLGAVDAIPEDCACLIINGPKSDLLGAENPSSYYERSESEIIDRYLAAGNGALMLFKDPDAMGFTNLTQLAEKWGISYVDGSVVKDETSSLGDAASTAAALRNTKLISKYNYNEESYAHSIYKDISSIDSAPAVIVERTGSVKRYFPDDNYLVSGNIESGYVYSDFLYSSDRARTYSVEGDFVTGEDDTYSLAALTVRSRTDSYSLEKYHSFVFCAATSALTDGTYLTNAAYANYDVMFSLVRYISGVNGYADINLGGESFNSDSVGGKRLQYSVMQEQDFTDSITGKDCAAFTSGSMTLWCIVLFALPVLTVAVVGTVICLRRRFL